MAAGNSDQVKQGTKAAKAELAGGAKLSIKIAKKIGGFAAKGGKIAVAAIAGIILLALLVQGMISSSMRETYRETPVYEDSDYNDPATDEETKDSIYNKDIALEETIKQVRVIHEAKQEDASDMDGAMERAVKKVVKQCDLGDVDVALSVEKAKKETAENSTLAYWIGEGSGGGISGTGAERIAQTAEKYAWPEGTKKSKYDVDQGGSGYNGFEQMFKRHFKSSLHFSRNGTSYTNHLSHGACCCHSANSIVSEALGVSGHLPSLMTPGKDNRKKLEKKGFTITKFNGDTGTLRRGDILTYKYSSGGHVFIYLGKNSKGKDMTCDGSLTNGYYPRIREWSNIKNISGKSVYLVIRYTKSDAGSESVTEQTDEAADDSTGRAAYDDITVLRTLSKGTGKKYDLKNYSGYAYQSFCCNGGNVYLQLITHGRYGRHGYILKCSADGMTLEKKSKYMQLRHGNGLTIDPATNTLYSVTSAYVGNNKKALKINADSLEMEGGAQDLPVGGSGIAYDETTGNYVISSNSAGGKGYLKVYKSDLKTHVKTITKKRWSTPGDIAAHNGIIINTISGGSSAAAENHVDLYSESTGEYLGTYEAPYGEIEGADIDETGQLILLFHSSEPFIQFTGINVTDGTATSVAEYISKLDMDILAAYNVSISNSSMYMNNEIEGQSDADGWLDDVGKYTDVRGQKVKVFWFGKNRGLINYEKDLKKKVDRLFKGNPVTLDTGNAGAGETEEKSSKSKHFYEIIVGTETENITTTDENGESVTKKIVPVTLKEREVKDLMEPVFGLDPKATYMNATGLRRGNEEQEVTQGSTNNLEAALSLSDNTGQFLFGDPVKVDPDMLTTYAGAGIYGTGSLKLPLPPGSFVVTSHCTMGKMRTDVNSGRPHDGVDLGAKTGTPVYASLAGVVTLAAPHGDYGNCVIIQSGNVEIKYAHLNEILCKKGDRVTLGKLIGRVGNTGYSFGSHLHFEVHIDGKLADPEPLLGLK